MPKLMFAWLGSGRSRRRKVGNSGRHLDLAARAGLPVPPGAILLDEFYRFALQNDLATVVGSRVIIPEPAVLHETLFQSVRLPRFDQPLVVTPVPDDALAQSQSRPQATFESHAKVDSSDPLALSQALAGAWSATGMKDTEARHDVLLREVVAAQTRGTALSCADADGDTVEYLPPADGTAESSSSGPASLARLSGWRRPSETLPPYTQRLQMLLRGVRHSMGRGDWRVAWNDDGEICWLTGLERLDL